MKYLAATILILIGAVSRGDTIDDAEAKRRNVPVQQIQLEKAQARIAELEKEVAALKASTKPATLALKPSTAPAPQQKAIALATALKDLPGNLKPTPKETERTRDQRGEWINNNLAGKRITVKFKVKIVDGTILINDDDSLRCSISRALPEDGGPVPTMNKIYAGDTVTLEGEFDGCQPVTPYLDYMKDMITLKGCVITELIESR